MRRGPAVAGLCLAAALSAAPGTARACALELLLAVDVSGSVDRHEFTIQMEGIAAALENPRVATVVEGLEGGMIIALTQWSGASRQRLMVPWRHVSDGEGLAGMAAAVRGAGRAWRNFSTGIGEALAHARVVSAGAPIACARRVVDVSGDGVSNEGRPPSMLARDLAAEGFTINGLAIRGADPDPVAHYESEVIAGPGAFVEVADGFEDFPRAILRKLLREIDRPMIVSAAEAGGAAGGPAARGGVAAGPGGP